MQGLPTKDFEYFHYGKAGHDAIQKHVSGQEEHPLLAKTLPIEHFNFPIVETKDFDEKTYFEMVIKDKYLFRGYRDGFNPEKKRRLEIKISTTPWPSSKYKTSMQKKCYDLCNPTDKSSVLVTARPDLGGLKAYEVASTQKDRDEAMAWIMKGISIIEEMDFDGGEAINCFRCVYQDVCEKRR